MRSVLTTLAAAALLAVAAAPSQALTLLPPSGQYIGSANNGANIVFSLDLSNHDQYLVRDFYIHGHKRFSQTGFRLPHGSYGEFSVRFPHHQNLHIWGAWQSTYGHVDGGYAYDYNGHRYIHHWTAKADGF